MTSIEKLLDFVGKHSTGSIVETCLLTQRFPDSRGLLAPYKQCNYLLSLMLTTPEPSRVENELTETEWNSHCKILNEVFGDYHKRYLPEPGDDPSSPDWSKPREVAMLTFAHHVTSRRVNSSLPQVISRIKAILVPFDSQIEERFKISASTLLSMIERLEAFLQSKADSFMIKAKDAESRRLKFVEKCKRERWTLEQAKEQAQLDPDASDSLECVLRFSDSFKFERHFLESEFGLEETRHFLDLFLSIRGNGNSQIYPTDALEAESKPIFEVSPGEYLVPVFNSLHYATENCLTDSLTSKDGKLKDAVLKKRDKFLEEATVGIVKGFFGPSAQVLVEACESQRGQFEHDVILIWNRRLLLIEAKAHRVKQPPRDPLEAYKRINEAFKASIQKAYDQANRVRKRLVNGERVPLYNLKSDKLLELNPQDFDEIYIVCVTSDSLGPVATGYSLLEKSRNEPFPLVVTYFDLETILNGFSHFGLGPKDFFQYLDQRLPLTKRLIASDELEPAGFFICNDGLHALAKANGRIILTPRDGEIFDDIWTELNCGKKADRYKKKRTLLEVSSTLGSAKKPGRNDLCHCGSGKKYKRCCLA